MPLRIVRNDLLNMEVDAIVNPTDTSLSGGGSIDEKIQQIGGALLEKELNKIGGLNVGEAVLTNAYNLKAKYIIHTSGPFYEPNNEEKASLLKLAYTNCLILATKYKITSIAFPLIASGTMSFPKYQALKIATQAFVEHLLDYQLDVYLVVYDNESFQISKKLFDDVFEYITDNYVANDSPNCNRLKVFSAAIQNEETFFDNLEEPFSAKLLKLIDKKGLLDPVVYKKANIDRKHFSKIRSNENYHPKKKTVFAFCIALELNLNESLELLESAGFTFSRSDKTDLIVEYFIKQKNYSIYEVNEVLFSFDLPLLD